MNTKTWMGLEGLVFQDVHGILQGLFYTIVHEVYGTLRVLLFDTGIQPCDVS